MAVQSTDTLDIYMGDDFSHVVTFYTSYTSPTVNTPESITGRTYRAQMRKTRKSTTTAATFTCTLTDAANGEMTFSLTDVETAALKSGSFVVDLEETNSGVVTTPVWWEATVTQDITR